VHKRADNLSILFQIEGFFCFETFVKLYLIFEARFGGVAIVHVVFVEETTGVGALGDGDGSSNIRAMNVDSDSD